MIAFVGIHVAAAVVEGGDGVGGEDRVERRGWIVADAVESYADGAASEAVSVILPVEIYQEMLEPGNGRPPLITRRPKSQQTESMSVIWD